MSALRLMRRVGQGSADQAVRRLRQWIDLDFLVAVFHLKENESKSEAPMICPSPGDKLIGTAAIVTHEQNLDFGMRPQALSNRQDMILSALNQKGRVLVDDLADRFDVSTQTIRKDLNELCDRGLASRIHGGARAGRSISNVDYQHRRLLSKVGKERVAAAAAALIPDECSLMMNIGTTTEQVARALYGHTGLVVITNNINIISALIGSPAKELILAGGAVRPSDGAIIGDAAVEFVSRYKADYAVIGASSIDADGAVLDYDAREVSVARAILKNARTRILVADMSKFARTAPVRICDIAEVDFLVTDGTPPDEFRRVAERAETRILVADPLAGAVDDAV